METGQKIIQQNNNIDELSSKILSIQLSLNGLSFCILDSDQNSIIFYKAYNFEKKANPTELLNRLSQTFNDDIDKQAPFKSVKAVYENELSVLVPGPLFEEDQLADYLKFNSRILQTDYITYDLIQSNDSVCVYIPYVNINNYLYDKFGVFEYRHFSTVLIDVLMSTEKNLNTKKMYVHVSKDHFEIIVLYNNDLLLYNTFEFSTKEDFIYYILFTAEQLQLNPEEFKLSLLGKIKEGDELYGIVFKYVRHVNVLELSTKYDLDKELEDVIQDDFVLLNSL